MDTKGVKSEFIKVRVTLEQKEKFKDLAKEKGVTVSDLVCGYIEKELEKHEFRLKNKEIVEERIKKTDKKLLELKERLIKK